MKPSFVRGAARVGIAAPLAFRAGSVSASAGPTPEGDGFLEDPQCGSKAAMDSLAQFFRAQASRTRLRRLPEVQALPVLPEGPARPVSGVRLAPPREGGSR